MKLRVLVYGGQGKLGSAICTELEKYKDLFDVFPRSRRTPLGPENNPLAPTIIVDATPAPGLLEFSQEITRISPSLKGVILASTGWENSAESELKKLLKNQKVLWAPNLSFGIRWLIQQVKTLPKPDDAHLIDIHHAAKRDAPSGTAKLIADVCKKFWNLSVNITSERVGTVPGTHQLHWKRGDETLLIEHKAESRAAFAAGSLDLINWLIQQPVGEYHLWDITP